jgi:hypothetical protein
MQTVINIMILRFMSDLSRMTLSIRMERFWALQQMSAGTLHVTLRLGLYGVFIALLLRREHLSL